MGGSSKLKRWVLYHKNLKAKNGQSMGKRCILLNKSNEISSNLYKWSEGKDKIIILYIANMDERKSSLKSCGTKAIFKRQSPDHR